jgi:tRNA threonylcarbamoyladenosine biosynthesis protein TsaE
MQGLVAAMGFEGEVPSPTYTISRVYPVKKNIAVYHFDFYRLHGTDVVTSELAEVLDEPSVIVAVEWWGNVGHDLLPPNRIRISISPGETHMDRNITIESLGGDFDYVVKGLQP